MVVCSVVIAILLHTTMLQVDGSSQSYLLQKALESALTTDETVFALRRAFFPVIPTNAQEVQHVRISISVEITVDQAPPNSAHSCTPCASNLDTTNSSTFQKVCWNFLWTDSALLSLITIDHLASFDSLAAGTYSVAMGGYSAKSVHACLPIVSPVMPKIADVKTSLMMLLSWSKSYAKHCGIPPQWEEADKGCIQEMYISHILAENVHNGSDSHQIRLELILTFTLLNILVLIGVLSNGKWCYSNVAKITSRSPQLAAMTWAFMITAALLNFLYLAWTLYGIKISTPVVWACIIAEEDRDLNWCASMKSSKLYSDEIISLSVKFSVVSFAVVVDLISSVRLTSHGLLRSPCTMATECLMPYFRLGNRVVQTILIWNVMVFTQISFGVVFLPFSILMAIAPVSTFSLISSLVLILIELTSFIAFFILQWCNPISLKQCRSFSFFVHMFTTVIILTLSVGSLTLYYYLLSLGVQPWSVKGSILSLLPSLLITPLLWFAKQCFFKKDRAGVQRMEQLQDLRFTP